MSYCIHSSDMLKDFLPIPSDPKRLKPKPAGVTFDDVVGFESERDLAERWVDIVNNEKSLCRGYKVCLSQDRWDPADSKKLKVDAAIYPRRKHPTDGRPHWGRQRALIEFKKGSTDNDPYNDLLGDAEARKPTDVRGQLASYSAYAFARQQRTANFLFLINGTRARVTLWERAGTMFTESFDYVENPDLMCEFLWRFSMLDEADQGLDPTAKLLPQSHKMFKLMDQIAAGPLPGQPEDICGDEGTVVPLPEQSSSGKTTPVGTFRYIREKFAASLDDDAPRYRLSVPTDQPHRFKYYLVGKPVFEATGMVGRGTRGYIAVDVQTKQFVWLKDVWRAHYVNVDAEGEILGKLHEANVSRIPTLLQAGDLRQETQMHYYVKPDPEAQDAEEFSGDSRGSKRDRSGASKTASDDKKERKQPRIRHLSHYRLIVKEVCLPVTEMKTSRQLIQVVLDCVEAHEDAVTKAKIIHGDISIGNVLILPTLVKKDKSWVVEWRGILADWELSKPIQEDGKIPRARQPERTGTWQFMSAALLYWLKLPISVEDEVESFFYIILNAGVRFLTSTVPDVASFFHSLFDGYQVEKRQYRCGSKKMDSMQCGLLTTADGPVQFIRPDARDDPFDHPLNVVLADMLPLFRARYAKITYDRAVARQLQIKKHKGSLPPGMVSTTPIPLAQSVIDSATRLKTHAHFKALLRRLLEEAEWSTADFVGDRLDVKEPVQVDGDDASPNEADADDDSNDSNGDASPTAKRLKKLQEDALTAIYGDEELEEAHMAVDEPGSSTSTTNRYTVSRSASRGSTMRGTTRRLTRCS